MAKNRPRKPLDPSAAAGAGSGLYGLPFTPEESAAIVVPVPFEATTSYGGGTSRGPEAVLNASHQVDLLDRETGRPYERGIAMLPMPRAIVRANAEAKRLARPIIESGGDVSGSAKLRSSLKRVNEIGDEINAHVRRVTARWLSAGKAVFVLGGDHSVPFGAIEAIAQRHSDLGILHIDAHADLRDAYEGFTWSHASIMFNVARKIRGISQIVQAGVRDLGEAEDRMIRASRGRIVTFFDADVASRLADGEPFACVASEIVATLPDTVYVSFDIDGLDPSLCPNTGTPVPGGLSFHQACCLLAELVRTGRTIVGGDLSEVSPGPDAGSGSGAVGEWDAAVGARVLYKMIGFALMSQNRARATRS